MSRQINIHTCYMYLTDHKQQMKVYQIGSQYLPPLTLKWDGASHESKKKIQTTTDTLICTCICSCFSSDLFLMPSATVWKYVLMNPFEERNWAKSEMKSKISVRKKEQLWCWVCGAEQPGAECSLSSAPRLAQHLKKNLNHCSGIQEKERSVDGIVWSLDYSWIHMDASTHWAGTYPAMWMTRCTYLCVIFFQPPSVRVRSLNI